jgi:hypothetical protein
MSLIAKLADAFRTKRRRLAPLVLLAAVAAIGGRMAGAVPREVHVRYDLGPEHGALHEAQVGYRFEGDEVQTVRFIYAQGAPRSIDHHVSLSPGRYEIVADLRGEDGARHVTRTLEVPADGVVRVELFDHALALASIGGARSRGPDPRVGSSP